MVPAQITNKTIIDVLLTKNVIGQELFDRIKLENVNTGKSLEQIIVDHNFASDEELTKAKAEVYQIPYLDLAEISISPEALSLVPQIVAERYVCFPYTFDKEKKQLVLAMKDPLDLKAIEFLEQKSEKIIIPAFATEERIKEAINQYYTQSLTTQVTAALKESSKEDRGGVRVVDAGKLDKIIREAPIAKIVSTLLEFAIKAKASDIHIEPQQDKTRIRYRIDGILHEKLVLPRTVHDAVISRIKILSKMKIDEKRIPQDGRFSFRSGLEEVDLRVSSLPSVNGEKIVMRLLKKTGGVPTLTDLGLRGLALKNINGSIFLANGIILVTGPTGSGKTTTLYAVLSKINTTRVNIITLEDPVEYEIPGINQVQINPTAGLTFASGLRSFLRQDPNIIMVGEIRDQETAGLAIQAALTGHLVFSTLHTNSASGALPRLLDMKAEPYLLASSMICVVAQRVVRKICTNCREEYQPPVEVIEDIKRILGPLFQQPSGPFKLYRGKKCPECNDTGYSGRVGIFEVLTVNERIGRLILERAPASKLEAQAKQDGMMTMTQDGYLKSLEGITTIEEVLRVSRA
ncbi:MAG TPA: GspE/PulE family protein [Candidatus Bathyarchaeia archaeon]|nr:GspE/PulE family protein [Candidatus Bathyarchaeia archaeon]